MENKIALLTGTINPKVFNTPFTKLMDEKERLKQYINSIKFYLKKSNFNIIIFCENSNYPYDYKELKKIAEKKNKILEIIRFLGNKKEIEKRGKGYGEGEIIEYALKHSKYLKNKNQTFYKITGRVIIKNINKILNNSPEENYFFSVGKNHCVTLFFKCSKRFYLRVFKKAYKMVNEKEGLYIENIFYLKIKKFSRYVNTFNEYPKYKGYSGTSGKIYKSYMKWFLRNLQMKFGLLKIR